MEGNQAIIKKILDDANKKASSIIDNALYETSLLKKEAEDWADNYKKTQKELLKKQTDEIISRRITVADLDVRKLKLQKKQDLINDILDKVYLELTKISKADYLKLIEKYIVASCDENDTIILSKDNVLKEDDIKELKVYQDKKLSISKERGNFIGGVYLTGKLSDKDLTFKSIIEMQRDELTTKIAENLFS